MTEPSVLRPLLCALMALICLVVSYYWKGDLQWPKTLFLGAGFVFLVFALVSLWLELAPLLADLETQKREAACLTEPVVLAREIRQMNSEQAAAHSTLSAF